MLSVFGREKLEWRVYQTVKKVRKYVSWFWQNTRTWQTDGRRERRTDRKPHAYA